MTPITKPDVRVNTPYAVSPKVGVISRQLSQYTIPSSGFLELLAAPDTIPLLVYEVSVWTQFSPAGVADYQVWIVDNNGGFVTEIIGSSETSNVDFARFGAYWKTPVPPYGIVLQPSYHVIIRYQYGGKNINLTGAVTYGYGA